MTFPIPPHIRSAMDTLEQYGHSVWLVGGCVRDLYLGQPPHDYDLTTSAAPDAIQTAFAHLEQVTVGARHGTIGVLFPEGMVEITTYRSDGSYSDSRHPDSVAFTDSLTEDLARRDFTVNAMAWHPIHGLQDPFGGLSDLEQHILRCVGDPAARFSEDALRVLRCARLSAQLGFAIDPDTYQAAKNAATQLSGVSAERITEELERLLLAPHPQLPLSEYPGLLDGVVHLKPTHLYDRLRVLPKDIAMRLTVLLLALPGKEDCAYSQLMAAAKHFFAGLRFPKRVSEEAVALLDGLFLQLPRTKPAAKRILRDVGLPRLQKILGLKTVLWGPQPLALFEEVLQNGECYSLPQLAVTGDLLPCTGAAVGETLAWLLEQVIDGALPNETQALLRAAAQYGEGVQWN